MSKVEVKVKKGDSFVTWCGALYLARNGAIVLRIADGGAFSGDSARFPNYISMEATNLPDPAARAWIESLGGTVVEEVEEVKVKVVAHATIDADGNPNGDICWSLEGTKQCERRDDKPASYRRIHIAGVTT